MVKVLIGNKFDNADQTDKVVNTSEGELFAINNQMKFFEVSARNGGDSIS